MCQIQIKMGKFLAIPSFMAIVAEFSASNVDVHLWAMWEIQIKMGMFHLLSVMNDTVTEDYTDTDDDDDVDDNKLTLCTKREW